MFDRFTRKSRTGRGNIARSARQRVFERDGYTCQYCGSQLDQRNATIDHLIPLASGGLNELTNFVTCCRACNEKKANIPLAEFARELRIKVEELPVHGDPVLENDNIPGKIKAIRRRIYEKMRRGQITASGHNAQKKIEKEYRREFWATEEGLRLKEIAPTLPGHVRVMIPEILSIAKSRREFMLLVELAKSANTRNLIGTVLTAESDVEHMTARILETSKDVALVKRLNQALARFHRMAGS